jgi:hypothetical protein
MTVPSMSAPRFVRSGRTGAVVGAAFAATIGFADRSHGPAIIGQTRQMLIEREAPRDVDAMKAGYRRPLLIPRASAA